MSYQRWVHLYLDTQHACRRTRLGAVGASGELTPPVDGTYMRLTPYIHHAHLMPRCCSLCLSGVLTPMWLNGDGGGSHKNAGPRLARLRLVRAALLPAHASMRRRRGDRRCRRCAVPAEASYFCTVEK